MLGDFDQVAAAAAGAPWHVRYGAFSLFRLLTYVCSSAASAETGASRTPIFTTADLFFVLNETNRLFGR